MGVSVHNVLVALQNFVSLARGDWKNKAVLLYLQYELMGQSCSEGEWGGPLVTLIILLVVVSSSHVTCLYTVCTRLSELQVNSAQSECWNNCTPC